MMIFADIEWRQLAKVSPAFVVSQVDSGHVTRQTDDDAIVVGPSDSVARQVDKLK